MKLLKGIAISLVLGALAAPAAMAQEEASAWGSFSGNVALTNDYLFRGYTQTLHNAAIQGGLDWDSGMGVYLGTWGSNVDFGIDGSMEWDIYGGYKFTIGEAFTVDVGAIGYLYPGAPSAANLDYWEAKIAMGYDFGAAALSASFYYSPEWTGGFDEAYYINGGVTVPVMEGLSISGFIGHQTFDNPALIDYTDYNIGISYAFPWFTADARFYDTDVPTASCGITTASGATHTLCDDRFVVKFSRAF